MQLFFIFCLVSVVVAIIAIKLDRKNRWMR
jgi:hypothetical protein